MIVGKGDRLTLTKPWGGLDAGAILDVLEVRANGMCFLGHDGMPLAAGWYASRMAEYFSFPGEDVSSIKEQIADEAKRIVSGARRNAYGTPEDNFERIARFWTAYFQNTDRDIAVLAEDVSPLMRLMKEARLCETPDHLDSHVDLVGYALTGAEVNKVKFPD